MSHDAEGTVQMMPENNREKPVQENTGTVNGPWGLTVILPDGTMVQERTDRDNVADRVVKITNPYNPWSPVEGIKVNVERYPRISIRESIKDAISGCSEGQIYVIFDENDGMQIVSQQGRLRSKSAIERGYARAESQPYCDVNEGGFYAYLPAIKKIIGHYGKKTRVVIDFLSGHKGGATLAEISNILGYSQHYIGRVLWKMEDEDLIMHMGVGPIKRYYLCNRR